MNPESKSESESKPELFRFHGRGIFSGEFDEMLPLENVLSQFGDSSIIEAWLDDVDIMEITLASPNIGFVYTFAKPYSGWKRPGP